MAITTLKERVDFMRVRGGRRYSTPAFLIECKLRHNTTNMHTKQDLPNNDNEDVKKAIFGPRFGFTVTKKLGNAVKRNRVKRRLKAVVSEIALQSADPRYDYVMLARNPALFRKFSDMVTDMQSALQRLHGFQKNCVSRRIRRPSRCVSKR
ncbi:MAG: Ribonuclease P protein component [Hyphomicrobiaceae bacterium hypho_1]